MIPAQNFIAWGNVVPWTDGRQVEQDLIICRALMDVFSNQMLRYALRHSWWNRAQQAALPCTAAILGGNQPGAHVEGRSVRS